MLSAGMLRTGWGVAIGQLVNLLAWVFFVGSMSVTEFGFYPVALAIGSVAAVFMTLRFEQLLLIKSGHSAVVVVALCSTILSCMTFAGLLIGVSVAIVFDGEPWFYILVPLVAMSQAQMQLTNTRLVAAGLYHGVSSYHLIRAAIVSSLQVSCILFYGPHFEVLLLGHVVGTLIASYRLVRVRGQIRLSFAMRMFSFIRIFKDFKEKLVPSNIQGGTSVFSNNFNVIAFDFVFGPGAAGIVGFAERFVKAPLNLLAASARGVSARAFRRTSGGMASQRALYWRISWLFLTFGLLAVVFGWLLVPFLLDELFSAEWQISVQYVLALLPWIPSNLLYTLSAVYLFYAVNQQLQLVHDIGLLVLKVSVAVLAVAFYVQPYSMYQILIALTVAMNLLLFFIVPRWVARTAPSSCKESS